MARNARRSTLREGYRIVWEWKQRGFPHWSVDEVNMTLHIRGVYEEGEPDLTDRSARHWERYYADGIHPDDYPSLNRWEIAHSATPPEFIDAT